MTDQFQQTTMGIGIATRFSGFGKLNMLAVLHVRNVFNMRLPSFGLDVKHWESTMGRKAEKRLDIYKSPSFSATCYSTFLTISYLNLFTRGKPSFDIKIIKLLNDHLRGSDQHQ